MKESLWILIHREETSANNRQKNWEEDDHLDVPIGHVLVHAIDEELAALLGHFGESALSEGTPVGGGAAFCALPPEGERMPRSKAAPAGGASSVAAPEHYKRFLTLFEKAYETV